MIKMRRLYRCRGLRSAYFTPHGRSLFALSYVPSPGWDRDQLHYRRVDHAMWVLEPLIFLLNMDPPWLAALGASAILAFKRRSTLLQAFTRYNVRWRSVGILVLDIRALSALMCGLRSPVPHGYVLRYRRRASLLLYPYVFVAGPNKHDDFHRVSDLAENSNTLRIRHLLPQIPNSPTRQPHKAA